MIRVTDRISIDPAELTFDFVRSSGPGGQNVNKVATAVQLRFDAKRSPSLPPSVRARLIRIAGQRATRDGVIVITAQRYRTQEKNRADAVERLVELVRSATVKPKPRKATRPTAASKERRLDDKRRQARRKANRSRPREDD